MLYLDAAPLAASALGLLVTLYLFASVKAELRKTMRRERARVDVLAAHIESGAGERQPVFIPVAPQPGLNIQRRAHALRLLRRGQDAAHIAAALAIPRREVELPIRVQQMVAAAIDNAAAPFTSLQSRDPHVDHDPLGSRDRARPV